MFKKIKNFLMATTLERIKNIAIVIIAFSLFAFVSFLVYETFFNEYERLSFDEIKVTGNSKIEIPKKKEFFIVAKNKNERNKFEKISEEVKVEIENNFNEFDLKVLGSSKNDFSGFNDLLSISFKNKNDEKVFIEFISDNFENKVELNPVLVKDENFEVNNDVLLKNALQDAKNKAEKIAEESNVQLGKLKKFDENSYNSDLDYKLKNDYVIKTVEVTYEIE